MRAEQEATGFRMGLPMCRCGCGQEGAVRGWGRSPEGRYDEPMCESAAAYVSECAAESEGEYWFKQEPLEKQG